MYNDFIFNRPNQNERVSTGIGIVYGVKVIMDT